VQSVELELAAILSRNASATPIDGTQPRFAGLYCSQRIGL
jgi:hypothetical protein